MTPCIGEVLRLHSKAVEAALHLDSGSARIEVQVLLQAVLQVNRAYLLTHAEQALNDQQYLSYAALLERRLCGEPIAYLLGEREFYGLTFKVSPATLIPRPETELLVELVLQRCGRVAALPPGTHRPPPCGGIPLQGACRVLDLGTGSGAIALSIAHARPDVEVVAVDVSAAALAVAQTNARHLQINNARLLHSDWFGALVAEKFDVIVSNPPYIAAADAHLAQGDLRFEPPAALASGADGLHDIRRIIAAAHEHLEAGGWLLFEHGYDQAQQVRALLQQAGFCEVFSARDLAGIERVSGGRTALLAS